MLRSASCARSRTIIADRFREIWTSAQAFDDIERVCRAISANGFWLEGWIAVRQSLRFDSSKVPLQIADRLSALEVLLRPKNIAERVKSVISGKAYDVALDEIEDQGSDDPSSQLHRSELAARSLGEHVGSDEKLLNEVLPEIVCGEGMSFWFGCGLAASSANPVERWKRLLSEFQLARPEKRNVQVLRGFLSDLSTRNRESAGSLLDAALADNETAPYYPALETSSEIEATGIVRLRRSLALENVPIENYQILAWGRSADPIPPAELKALLQIISSKRGGFPVAVKILAMRIFSERNQKLAAKPELIDAGQRLLETVDFGTKSDRQDHDLASIARYCLAGVDGSPIVRSICEKLRAAHAKYYVNSFDYGDLARAMFEVQPRAALDGFFGGTHSEQSRGRSFLDEDDPRFNPVVALPESVLFAWCDVEPRTRYPIAAAVMPVFEIASEKAPLTWKDAALRLLEKAPERIQVLKQFARRIRPTGWSGSLAALLESRLGLLSAFENHADPIVQQFARDERERLGHEIQVEQRREAAEEVLRDRKFE